jgi:cold shock CspA family protein
VTPVQATVLTFDRETGAGSVVRDDGSVLAFSADVFALSGLRLLRAGQRVKVTLSDAGDVTSITIMSLPSPS